MNDVPAAKDCVGVVEDDAAVRNALRLMLLEMGIEVCAFTSAQDYLDDQQAPHRCGCLVVDVRLPGISGMELHQQLLKLNPAPAVIFITGHGDIQMAVEAMRNGAVDFLQKPFREQQLLDSVQKALNLARCAREIRSKSEVVTARLACLTPKEQSVLDCLLSGMRTKEIALELGVATKTAEAHRANIMRKMHASSINDLVLMCNKKGSYCVLRQHRSV